MTATKKLDPSIGYHLAISFIIFPGRKADNESTQDQMTITFAGLTASKKVNRQYLLTVVS
jgi:hypothetical protein